VRQVGAAIRFVHDDTTSDVTVRKHSADPGICMGYVRDGKRSSCKQKTDGIVVFRG